VSEPVPLVEVADGVARVTLNSPEVRNALDTETVAEFQPEATELVHFGLVKSVPSLSTVEDTTMVASLYHGKKLIWP